MVELYLLLWQSLRVSCNDYVFNNRGNFFFVMISILEKPLRRNKKYLWISSPFICLCINKLLGANRFYTLFPGLYRLVIDNKCFIFILCFSSNSCFAKNFVESGFAFMKLILSFEEEGELYRISFCPVFCILL